LAVIAGMMRRRAGVARRTQNPYLSGSTVECGTKQDKASIERNKRSIVRGGS
jgi:hypothetical protein